MNSKMIREMKAAIAPSVSEPSVLRVQILEDTKCASGEICRSEGAGAAESRQLKREGAFREPRGYGSADFNRERTRSAL